MDQNTKEKIQNLINQNKICLFMKGTSEVPQCGFSMAVSNVLKHLKIDFKGNLHRPSGPFFSNSKFSTIFLNENQKKKKLGNFQIL